MANLPTAVTGAENDKADKRWISSSIVIRISPPSSTRTQEEGQQNMDKAGEIKVWSAESNAAGNVMSLDF